MFLPLKVKCLWSVEPGLTRRGSSPQQHSGGCTWAFSGRKWQSGCSMDQGPDQGDLRTGQVHRTHSDYSQWERALWSLIGCSGQWNRSWEEKQKWTKQADNLPNMLKTRVIFQLLLICWRTIMSLFKQIGPHSRMKMACSVVFVCLSAGLGLQGPAVQKA